jgi:type IV secretion system protein VirB4
MRKRLTTVYLDKDRGAEMNIRALGGRYYRVISMVTPRVEPVFAVTHETQYQFHQSVDETAVHRNGATITPRDERRLSDAVNAVMSNEPQYRVYGITRMLENLPEPATKKPRRTA